MLHKNFSGIDCFCDEDGNANPELPKGKFENLFSEENGKTLVTIISTHNSLEDIEMIIEMGYKEGINMTLQNLEEYLNDKMKN